MDIYKLLFEAEKGKFPEKEDDDIRVGKKSRLARDSADDQIDSLLIKYESESIREEDTLEESLSRQSLKFLLKEQEGAIDPAADAEATTGSEMQDEDEAGEEEQADLDIDVFSSKVARLIMNYDHLLKIESVILNRAVEFLKDNYDGEHAERFYAILEEQFDIEIDEDFIDDEGRPAPQGLGAYDGGSGGGGA
jgi:hypothetical protein